MREWRPGVPENRMIFRVVSGLGFPENRKVLRVSGAQISETCATKKQCSKKQFFINYAGVAERQTRKFQVLVVAILCGFKSHLPHQKKAVRIIGLFFFIHYNFTSITGAQQYVNSCIVIIGGQQNIM